MIQMCSIFLNGIPAKTLLYQTGAVQKVCHYRYCDLYMFITVRDSIEEVKFFKSIFGVFGVRTVGAIHHFQYPNSFNKYT